MDVNTINTLISSIGFPIVMVLIACYYIKYLNESHKEEVENLNSQHSQQIEKLTEALNNNTSIMMELKTIIENLKKGGE